MAEEIKKIEHSIINQIGRGSVLNTVKAMIMPALAFASKLRLRYGSYPQPTLARTEYRMSQHTLLPVDLRGEGILKIKLRHQAGAHHPLVVDLHGVFDRITAAKLMKRIKSYLAKNQGNLAINFRGLTSIDRGALLMFFKKLRAYSERIKLVSIDYLKNEWGDIVNYAKSYFDVLTDEDSLASCQA